MDIFSFQRLPARLTDYSFEEILETAKIFNGELCVVVRPEEKDKSNKVQAQFWVVNRDGSGRSFYNKHRNRKGSILCILPFWFIEYLLNK